MESTVEALTAAADTKGALVRGSRTQHFILSALAGSVFLALLVAQSGALGGEPQRAFIENTAAGKMHLAFGSAFARGILANWLAAPVKTWQRSHLVAVASRADAA